MKYLIPLILLLIFSCENNITENSESEEFSLLFIASEGNFGSSNGSIEVFKGDEKIQTVNNVGDVIQSILVFEDDLFVAVNNSHTIKKYDITESGLALPGIEVSTNNSGPREMCVVDDKLYFTNWLTKDIKVLDLNTYVISSFSIKIVPVLSKPVELVISISVSVASNASANVVVTISSSCVTFSLLM